MIYKTHQIIVTRYQASMSGVTTFFGNRDYNATGNHIIFTFAPNDVTNSSLGDNAKSFLDGFIQLDLRWAEGNGIGDQLEVVNDISALFESGEYDESENIQVNYYGAQALNVSNNDGWSRMVVVVNFDAQKSEVLNNLLFEDGQLFLFEDGVEFLY